MGAKTPGESRAQVGAAPDAVGRAAPASRAIAGDVVTMRDIADAAGVSLSTVSRVINEAPSRVPIAPQTRDRILKEAVRLGYRPNPFARALRGAPTMLLGAVVRDFSDPFFAGALEALAVEAMARGYNIILGHVQGREQEGLALPAVLEPRRCDAVIMLGDDGGSAPTPGGPARREGSGGRALAGTQSHPLPDRRCR